MKFQTLLINSSSNLSRAGLNSFLKENIELTEEIANLNSLEITTTKNTIGIGELKEISEWINLKSSKIKFVIINNAETLTPEAQNSLLKNLEEPPENTLFILLTKNNERILETIRSRSLQLFTKTAIKNNEVYKELALKFLKANFLEKLKMSENFPKEFESREEIAEIVFEILKNLPRDKNYPEKIKILKNIYLGIKASVNLKLSLDLLAITTADV